MFTVEPVKIFVGVDVSKSVLDVFRPDTRELIKVVSLTIIRNSRLW